MCSNILVEKRECKKGWTLIKTYYDDKVTYYNCKQVHWGEGRLGELGFQITGRSPTLPHTLRGWSGDLNAYTTRVSELEIIIFRSSGPATSDYLSGPRNLTRLIWQVYTVKTRGGSMAMGSRNTAVKGLFVSSGVSLYMAVGVTVEG